jgi:Ca-activated chloride channel family protein
VVSLAAEAQRSAPAINDALAHLSDSMFVFEPRNLEKSNTFMGLKALLTIVVIFALGGVVGAQTEPDEVLRTSTNLVNVFFSAVDKQDRYITILNESDVRVYEDGLEQRILTFENSKSLALSVAILIDVSGSQGNILAKEKDAVRLFTKLVANSHDDRIALVSFAGNPYLEQSLTNQSVDIEPVLDRIKKIGTQYQGLGTLLPVGAKPATGSIIYTSAIWDAVWLTCKGILPKPGGKRRNVLVMVTDGEDTSSRATLDEAISRAVESDAVVYAIGVGDTTLTDGVNRKQLTRLANETGGRFFQPKTTEDLNSSFAGIEQDLRSQYVITYKPMEKDSASFRQVRLEITNNAMKKLVRTITYRRGYYFGGSNDTHAAP